MNLFSCFRDTFCRIFERKKTLIALACVYVAFIVLGIIFIKTPTIYAYHINLCDLYVYRVCYSDENVFVLFLERFFGNTVFLLIILCTGVHWAGLFMPCLVLAYRAYTFGGSLAIFFSVYKMSGALIVFILYLPIHLLLDVVFICASTLSFGRARCFRFKRADFMDLLRDFLILLAIVLAICILEMLLLVMLFHPIGNLL